MTDAPMKEAVRIEHEDGITVFQIRSLTVFWEDIGIKSDANRFAAGKKWSEVEDWLSQNCQRAWNAHRNGIWFLEPDDAMLFKLTWAGKIV